MGNYQPCGNNSFFLVAAFQRRWWVRPWANILVENWYDDWDSTKRTRDPRTIVCVCVCIRIVNWNYVAMTSYYLRDKLVGIGAVHSDSIFVYWSHKFIQRSRDIIVMSSWCHQLIHHFNLKRCNIIMAQWLFYSLNSAFTDVCGKALFFIRTFYMFERFFSRDVSDSTFGHIWALLVF